MKWVFIGASTIASQHMINAVRSCVPNDVSWIVGGESSRVARWAEQHGIPNHTTSLDQALLDDDVQAVYISSTNEKHVHQALAAISAGKHVLCEKPLAMTLADAHEMVTASKKAKVVFATNHHLRCSGSHRKVRNLIKDGRIGRVLSLRIHHAVYLPESLQGWRIKDAKAGGGVIADITVHDADVTRFLLDEDPVSVVAKKSISGMGQGVEDSVMSVWNMPSGVMVMAHESFTHQFAGTGFEVHGDSGSIFAKDVMTQMPLGSIELVTIAGRETISYSEHDLYAQGIIDFVGAIDGSARPAADGVDGVKSLAVAMAVRESAQNNRCVNVNYEKPI